MSICVCLEKRSSLFDTKNAKPFIELGNDSPMAASEDVAHSGGRESSKNENERKSVGAVPR